MSQEISKEAFVAVVYALHEELGKHNHDQESFVLTIKREPSNWSNKIQVMRTLPVRS